jgi:hypothetical protein
VFCLCSLRAPSIAVSGKRAGMWCPTTGIALERREAPGPSQGPPRPGTPTPSKPMGPGILARARLSQSRAGSLANSPALLGAPTLFLREGKREDYGPARAPEFKARVRGVLAEWI